MSNTIEDKISLFTKVIIERIELDFQQRQKKLVEYYENRKTTLINDNEERKRTVVARATKDAEDKKQQIILKAKSAMRLAVLKKKQEFTKRIIDEVKKRTRVFINTVEYLEFLKKSIKEVLSKFSDGQFVIFSFSRNDFENRQLEVLSTIRSFRSEVAYKIEVVDSLIGGVFAKSSDGRLEIDFTIDTILEESNRLVGEALSLWLNKE